ncbi:hypothetical protein IE53DRAFT_34730, partial [Violaceomyces palustris]
MDADAPSKMVSEPKEEMKGVREPKQVGDLSQLGRNGQNLADHLVQERQENLLATPAQNLTKGSIPDAGETTSEDDQPKQRPSQQRRDSSPLPSLESSASSVNNEPTVQNGENASLSCSSSGTRPRLEKRDTTDSPQAASHSRSGKFKGQFEEAEADPDLYGLRRSGRSAKKS